MSDRRRAAAMHFLARLAGGAWLIEASLYLIVTVLYVQVMVVSLPWAAAMLVVGLQLVGGQPSRRWLLGSVFLAGLSIVAIWASANRDVWAYLVSVGVAGAASVLALLTHPGNDASGSTQTDPAPADASSGGTSAA